MRRTPPFYKKSIDTLMSMYCTLMFNDDDDCRMMMMIPMIMMMYIIYIYIYMYCIYSIYCLPTYNIIHLEKGDSNKKKLQASRISIYKVSIHILTYTRRNVCIKIIYTYIIVCTTHIHCRDIECVTIPF